MLEQSLPENQQLLMAIHTQIGVIDTKLEYMARDFKEFKDEMSTKYAGMEKTVSEDHQALRDLKLIWKLVMGGSGAFAAFIAFVITISVNAFKVANK